MICLVTKGFCASEDVAYSYQGSGNGNKETEKRVIFKQPSPRNYCPNRLGFNTVLRLYFGRDPWACVTYISFLCREAQFQLLWLLCWTFAFPFLSVTITIELLEHLEKYNLWHFIQFLHPYSCALLKKQTENPHNSGVHGQEKLWLGRIKK